MNIMIFNKFIKHIDNEFVPPEVDYDNLSVIQNKINDKFYFQFISDRTNGGFFFNQALHLYGFCNEPTYHSIDVVNHFIYNEFKELSKGLFFFGQDIFGNQFGFGKSGIVFFNIETAEREIIAKDFVKWIEVIFEDLEFLTGQKFVKQWAIKNKETIEYNQRFCPKKPFIVGGDYDTSNLYLQQFPLYLSSNANIARQVYNLPDGTDINIKMTD